LIWGIILSRLWKLIHIDYNRREGKDDSFLDNNSIAGLLGSDLGLDVDGYFNRYGLKNPVEYVA